MKRRILSILFILGLITSLIAVPAQAAPPEDIEASIEAGLDCLVPQQHPDGYWPGWDPVARTGFAVVKLEDRGYELALTDPEIDGPFDPDYEYSSNVIAGLNYIFSQAAAPAVGGICFAAGGHETYNTGIAMMAIAASRTPDSVVSVGNPVVDGKTYKEVLQANVNYFAAAQNPDGGWRYWASPQQSDQSNTGYAVLGLRYAEAEVYDFECTIPASIKTGLTNYIDYIQCKTAGPNYGGSGYVGPCDWVNCLKTGNLLFEMAFCGIGTDNQSVQDAIDYIELHWDDPNDDPGWQNHYQAMYCLMKGFESEGIETITVNRGGNDVEVDWFDEISTAIVATQNADGSWPMDVWGDSMLATEWALLTLERVAPPPVAIPVPVDIKPQSCPNPLNVDSKGVLPVAILGTEDFDVTQVDPVSVCLTIEGLEVGVSPLRWAYEDVATPYEPYLGKEYCMDCTTEGPDGYMDLSIKFKTQELVEILGLAGYPDGECIVLKLTGNLKEEFNGTPIAGEDVVRIIMK